MAHKASTKVQAKDGTELTLYGQVTEDGTQVRVWSKRANHGFYNLNRFEGGTLTAQSFRAFFGGK